MNIEELHERVREGKLIFGDYEEKKEWKPERLENYSKPIFHIPESCAKGSEAKRRKKLSKVLTFIESVQHKRFADGCTIMPIASTSSEYQWIWGSHVNVVRAIEYMKEIGLIKLHSNFYRFNAPRDVENTSKTYEYFYENEQEIIKYCEEKGITKFVPLNDLSIGDKEKKIIKKVMDAIDGFSDSDVIFSSDLSLRKPETVSVGEFELYLLNCLYKNYPGFKLWQQKVDEINGRFYMNQPEFAIRFRPKFHWNDKMNKVVGIGIRATNSWCTIKKEDREVLLDSLGYRLRKDIKSSVPRLTLSLNQKQWVDETIDIYELINNEYEPGSVFTDERREAIKKFHMQAYFDDGTDRYLGKNVWIKMDKSGAVKDEVDLVMGTLKRAIVKAEGGKTYGSEIFYAESMVYLMTLYDLLCSGHKVWLVYDAFYSVGEEDEKTYEYMVESAVKSNFNDFIKSYLKMI